MRTPVRVLIAAIGVLCSVGSASGQDSGNAVVFKEEGQASYYGGQFHGRTTIAFALTRCWFYFRMLVKIHDADEACTAVGDHRRPDRVVGPGSQAEAAQAGPQHTVRRWAPCTRRPAPRDGRDRSRLRTVLR
jgi:hypothetical protein